MAVLAPLPTAVPPVAAFELKSAPKSPEFFDPGGALGEAFSQLGTWANATFAPGGLVGQAFSLFGTWLNSMFAPGGPIGGAMSVFGSAMHEWVWPSAPERSL